MDDTKSIDSLHGELRIVLDALCPNQAGDVESVIYLIDDLIEAKIEAALAAHVAKGLRESEECRVWYESLRHRAVKKSNGHPA